MEEEGAYDDKELIKDCSFNLMNSSRYIEKINSLQLSPFIMSNSSQDSLNAVFIVVNLDESVIV